MTVGVIGPSWADTSGKPERVLNPLRVQAHVSRMVATLVPGVIATTTHARYYALHPWLAAEAEKRHLDNEGLRDLIRRAEVTLAWVSANHGAHIVELPVAHGQDELRRYAINDALDVESASQPGAYMRHPAGFAGSTYGNSEVELGLLTANWERGPRFDGRAFEAAALSFTGLLDLAETPTISSSEASAAAHAGLCVCAARHGEAGVWLRDLICGRLGGSRWESVDEARRDAIKLLVRGVAANPTGVDDPLDSLRNALVYSGPLEGVPISKGLVDIAGAWRGLFLRHLAVTAWRQLWTAIVDECVGVTTAEVAEAISSQFEDVTVGEFADRLRTIDGDRMLPVEAEAWFAHPGPVGDVTVLAIAAQRVSQVDGPARIVLCGDNQAELGPAWFAAQIDAARTYRLRAWVAQQVGRLLDRSQRIALEKFRLDPEGRGIVPAQVRERDGRWRQVGETGSAPLNLRLAALASVLASCGILDHLGDRWTVTEDGRSLVGPPQ